MPSHPLESEASPTAAPSPEAVLIRRAREACGLSYDAAAERLKIKLSSRRWRQLEEGYERRGGKPAPINNAPLAHMAYVVGVSPERLDDVGRGEAAEILREIIRQERRPEEPEAPPNPDVAEATRRIRENPRLARAFLDLLRGGPPDPPPTPGEGRHEDTG